MGRRASGAAVGHSAIQQNGRRPLLHPALLKISSTWLDLRIRLFRTTSDVLGRVGQTRPIKSRCCSAICLIHLTTAAWIAQSPFSLRHSIAH
jgi:hypothetical protein